MLSKPVDKSTEYQLTVQNISFEEIVELDYYGKIVNLTKRIDVIIIWNNAMFMNLSETNINVEINKEIQNNVITNL